MTIQEVGSSRVIEEKRGWPFSRWTKIEKEKSLVGFLLVREAERENRQLLEKEEKGKLVSLG